MDLRVGRFDKIPEFGPEDEKEMGVHPVNEPTPPHMIQMHPAPANLDHLRDLNPILHLYGEEVLDRARFYFD